MIENPWQITGNLIVLVIVGVPAMVALAFAAALILGAIKRWCDK